MTYEVNQPNLGSRAYCIVCNKRFYSRRGLEVTLKKVEQDLSQYRTGIPEADSSFEKFIFPMMSSVYPNLVTNYVHASVYVCSEPCANMYIFQQI